jgi:hypothetical protein
MNGIYLIGRLSGMIRGPHTMAEKYPQQPTMSRKRFRSNKNAYLE